jgi:hypothetical protein
MRILLVTLLVFLSISISDVKASEEINSKDVLMKGKVIFTNENVVLIKYDKELYGCYFRRGPNNNLAKYKCWLAEEYPYLS